ncbi:acyltransferase family protein [Virgibacillus halophilus]|uniref:Acyltransferase family protein n=1 Tax=Tigheibacillus halophilus TaxID=361280 RepID=A0ABU5C4M8_9BACI|nr:acyltransferase family protein [Virgibacillus halophilus]
MIPMQRNAYFDNARLLLILLVVFGHMVQPFTDNSNGVNTIYTWIYTFHMPAFIFLAGFFAKGAGNKEYIIKLAKKLLIPYIIFQVIYSGYYFLLGRDNWMTDSLFYPHWALWFLFSLFCWHILLFWFKKTSASTGNACGCTNRPACRLFWTNRPVIQFVEDFCLLPIFPFGLLGND